MRFQWVASWALGLAVVSANARPTELTFEGPPQCDHAEGVREQIERLVGRPLRESEGADFEVNAEQTANSNWRATVRTILRDTSASPNEREFKGKTCAEVSDAAAVAIAMTLEQHSQEAAAGAPATVEAPSKAPSEAHAPNRTPLAPAASRPNSGSAATKPSHWRARAALHGVIEKGSLPSPSPGTELHLAVGAGNFQAALLGSMLAPQSIRLADGKGGEFQLRLIGLLACGERSLGPMDGRACLGFEWGQLAAEGAGVRNPRIGNGTWRAARADLGVGRGLGSALSITLRGALVAPLDRQAFVLDGDERVFRPSSFSVRGLLGVELEI